MLLTMLGKWFWDPIKNMVGASFRPYTQVGRQDAQEDENASQGGLALSSQSWHRMKGSSDLELVLGPKQLFIL